MNGEPSHNPGPDDDAFDESELPALLAAFDAVLKTGEATRATAETPIDVPKSRQKEWDRARACLRLLEEAWPRSAARDAAGPPSGEDRRRVGAPASFGRFAIRQELGRGGFGVVYLAHDPALARDVALKIPHAHILSNPDLRLRFEREAQAAAGLDHPHIVTVYETGEIGTTAYIALAYCPGVTLHDWLRQREEPVPCDECASFIATLADAVHYAHGRGVIHRDLKPANVLLTRASDGRPLTASPKITDFGLAKHLDGMGTETRTGMIAGTPSYMAPEQAAGRSSQVGPATDVYALGAILYEMLTGRAPFQGESVLDTLELIRNQEPVPPRQLRAGIARDVVTICLKCLEKDSRRRYPTAAALEQDLRQYLGGHPIHARPVSVAERTWRWCRRHPLTASLVATAVTLLITIVAVLVSSNITTTAALETADEERSNAESREREAVAARKETAAALATAVEQRDAAVRNAYVAHMQMARHASERLDLVSLERSLNMYLPKAGETDLRHWEWYHHKARIGRIVNGKYHHSRSLYGVAWSADGKQVAACGADGRILICDAEGRVLHIWDGHPGAAKMVSFASAGNRLASLGDDGALRVWVTDGKLERELAVSGVILECMGYERGGKRIAAGGDNGHLYIWDADSGEQLADLPGRSAVRCLAWSPDGKSIAAGGSRLRVWDVAQRRLSGESTRQNGVLMGAAWDATGQRVAAITWSESLLIFKAAAPQEPPTPLTTNRHYVACVDWSRVPARGCGSRIVTGGQDSRLQWWAADASPAEQKHPSLYVHTSNVHRLAISPDGSLLASVGGDGNLIVTHTSLPDGDRKWTAHESAVRSLAWDPRSQRLLTGGYDNFARLWNAETGSLGTPKSSPRQERRILRVRWSPDGRYFATAPHSDEPITIWNADTIEPIRTFRIAGSVELDEIAYSPDGKRLAVGTSEGAIHLCNLSDGRGPVLTGVHSARVFGLSFSPDGRWLASCARGGTVAIWHANTGRLACRLARHRGDASAVAWSPDGWRLVTCGSGGEIRIVDATTGVVMHQIAGHGATVFEIAWSADAKRLVSAANDGTVRLWNPDAGQEVFSFEPGGATDVYAVDWSKDGMKIAAGKGDGEVLVWDASSGCQAEDRARMTCPPAIDGERHARLLVASLLDECGTVAEVEARLRREPGVSQPVRDAAVTELADKKDQLVKLNQLSWQTVSLAGQSPEEYRLALARAVTLVAKAPDNGAYLNTLGVAQFRVGDYAAALTTLERSHAINSASTMGVQPGDAAFLAMSLKALGRGDEAAVRRNQLQCLIQETKWAEDKLASCWQREVQRTFEPGERPLDAQDKPLNFDFETGTLADWHAEGSAFAGPPVRFNSRATLVQGLGTEHQGEYWLSSDAAEGPRATGVLTSTPFKVSQPFASFFVGGGMSAGTRVEVVGHESGQLIATTTGGGRQHLVRFIADLSKHVGQTIVVRVIDQETGRDGVIRFDDFRFHARRPELDPTTSSGHPDLNLQQARNSVLPLRK